MSENVHPSAATGPVPALVESGASLSDNIAQNIASVNLSLSLRVFLHLHVRNKRFFGPPSYRAHVLLCLLL